MENKIQYFVEWYNEDMDRQTAHFESDIKYISKSQIENVLNVDLYNNWHCSEVKER